MFLWEYVVAPETTFTIGQNCSTTYHMLSFWFVLKLAPCHVKRNEEWDINGFFSCLILFLWSSWSRAFRKMCWAKLLRAHVITEMNEHFVMTFSCDGHGPASAVRRSAGCRLRRRQAVPLDGQPHPDPGGGGWRRRKRRPASQTSNHQSNRKRLR